MSLQVQVPLITFKREKEVARRLLFDGCWISEEEEDEERGLLETLFWYIFSYIGVSRSLFCVL